MNDTLLWEDGEVVLSRKTCEGGPSQLVLASQNPTKLQRAFALRGELSATWAAVPTALVEDGAKLLSEDPGGELLSRLIGRPRTIDSFLRVAIGITASLRQLHARGLIHKDIKPANILVDEASGHAWLIGFGVTSPLPRERQSPEPPEMIAGTLAYMAPEQTGRMNRSIDSRSDLYALGVTLYELLAGRLPFSATDPIGWVHCHIARQPAPLNDVPPQVSAILMKLLAKTAEERYQTSAGVEHDLRRARGEASFTLGTHDASDRLHLPEKLYGREKEIAVLLESFERVVLRGESQLVLVSGYSGIGKSSVVNELHRVLVPPRGLYASGKFDQYKRDIPYATLAQAFVVLIRQILSKSERELATWRERITTALWPNGQLIANLVPELELVVGKQAPVPDVAPTDAQARFQTVVRRFLAVFAQAEHPLALFLDDLQWLDGATLELLEHLLGDPEVRHLMIVGAYRDHEVGPAHPLARTIEKLRGSPRVREIVLEPLTNSDLTSLCADALRTEREAVQPLAALVHEKTGGNPFFVLRFVEALADERLLVFDAEAASWRWDVDAIHAKGFTDNVVDLMAAKIDRLPVVTKTALLQLAFLGTSTSLTTLRRVSESTDAYLHASLADAVTAGLVTRLPTGYAFLHDRILEAAYAATPEHERAVQHLRIGRLLQTGDDVFEIVSHLNRATALITSPAEREHLAELNRKAGARAMGATAHAAARTYVALGLSLLGHERWERTFRLTFELELQLAQCEFVMADLDAAEARLDELGTRAQTLPDRAAVIFVQTNLYTAMIGRADRAVEICLRYLRLVGIDWPAHPDAEMVQSEYRALLERLGGRSIDELLNLPLSTDPDFAATTEVLLGMFTPAFNTDPSLVAVLLCRMGVLGLEHGNTDALSLAYAFLGMVLGSAFGDYQTGFLFGKLARDLVEQRGLERYRGRVHHTLGTHVLAWTQPLSSAMASLRRGLAAMQEDGDVTYVAFGYIGIATVALGVGEPLERLQAESEAAFAIVQRGKFAICIDAFVGHLRLIRALRGLLDDPCSLVEERDTELDYGSSLDRTRGWFWIRVMQSCFFFGDYAAAHAACRNAEPLLLFSVSFFELAEYHFFAALVAAQLDLRGEVLSHRKQLAVWAESSPANFDNRVALVDAELARLEGRPLEAMDAYERAIRSSRDNHFVHNEALAYELAARFYEGRGFAAIAEAYLEKARAGYQRWGAAGKVRQLDRAHPGLRAEAAPQRTTGAQLEGIDLQTVVKTSQAVSFEVGVERVIESLMVITLQHAGAERGLLLLQRSDGIWIEAEATTKPDGVSVQLERRRVADLPISMLQYTTRTHETVLLDDAQLSHPFTSDPYLSARTCRSVLCLPLVKQTEVLGVLYLENNLAPHVFTPSRVEVLKLLASQAAISLENASLEEKEALLKEVHHRVKNNLQLISSMLNLQASRIRDPAVAELFADSRNRVRTMALVHENLYRAGNFSKIPMAGHVRALCDQLLRAYRTPEQKIELAVDIDDVQLDMNRAVTCGLIVNELVSNALKHAFPSGRAGRITIELGARMLRVSDDGVGLPSSFSIETADSLGLQLVGDLAHQLRGALTVTRQGGTTFTVSFA